MNIEFKNPPNDQRNRGDWDLVAEQLKSRSGEWALVVANKGHATDANRIKNGIIKAFRPPGSFESRSVSLKGGGYDIYARHVAESVEVAS